MTTSGSTFPQRLTRIDDLTRPDHTYLSSDDDCYFLGVYTARGGYAFSVTNNLINNSKKSMEYKDNPSVWRHKERAIIEVAEAFRLALLDPAPEMLTFVPIPPSKAKNDPGYDDRVVRMLLAIRAQPPVDVRDL